MKFLTEISFDTEKMLDGNVYYQLAVSWADLDDVVGAKSVGNWKMQGIIPQSKLKGVTVTFQKHGGLSVVVDGLKSLVDKLEQELKS